MEKQKVHEDPVKRSSDDADEDEDKAAYEDSWYRSLKAISERKPVENDEDVEGPAD